MGVISAIRPRRKASEAFWPIPVNYDPLNALRERGFFFGPFPSSL
jgi:hypothetical protein